MFQIHRAGGALRSGAGVNIESLPVVEMESTVHDTPNLPEPEDQEEAPSLTPLEVQCEDDIVKKSAAITFEICLEHLLNFLKLPITQCTYADPVLNQPCGADIDFKIKTRGTAYVIEWVWLLSNILINFFFFILFEGIFHQFESVWDFNLFNVHSCLFTLEMP